MSTKTEMPVSFTRRQSEEFMLGFKSADVIEDLMPAVILEVGDNADQEKMLWATARLAARVAATHAQAAMNASVAAGTTVTMEEAADGAAWIAGAAVAASEAAISAAWCASIGGSSEEIGKSDEIGKTVKSAMVEIISKAALTVEYTVKKEEKDTGLTAPDTLMALTVATTVAGLAADAAQATATGGSAMTLVEETLCKFKSAAESVVLGG